MAAFEIPHAEMFAVQRKVSLPGRLGEGKEAAGESMEEFERENLRNGPPQQLWEQFDRRDERGGVLQQKPNDSYVELHRGYLHVYQTNRPLKLLYIDGMSAAKGDLGPMDTQVSSF